VETLETLSDLLSAGALGEEHFARAVDAVLTATHSDEAFLVLLDAYGMPLDTHLRGQDPPALAARAAQLAHLAGSCDSGAAASVLGDPHLIEALRAELIAGGAGPQGILAVRRPGRPAYSDAERSFFRALANLLAGALARLAYLRRASEDPLTGTGSRLALELAFDQALHRARDAGTTLSVMLIDVDHFKRINDTHGHLSGDDVLGAVAGILRSRLRTRDFVARYGGDEFLVLLPATELEEAAMVAEDLRATVAATRFGVVGLEVSLSIGVAAFPHAGDDPRHLLAAADRALYDSKRAGRNRVSTDAHASPARTAAPRPTKPPRTGR
jgi:diguanylate cyclase (GGDEF)-like protein